MANQELHQRQLRVGPMQSSVKRCRSIKDRNRLWKVGVRDLGRDICCALHHSGFVFPLGSRRLNRDKLKYVAARDSLAIPPEITVEGTVGVGAIPQGFGLEVELRIALPGLSHREAEALVHKAHRVCPYANATRNNIAVRLVLVSSHA